MRERETVVGADLGSPGNDGYVESLLSNSWLSRAKEALKQFTIPLDDFSDMRLVDAPRGQGRPLAVGRKAAAVDIKAC